MMMWVHSDWCDLMQIDVDCNGTYDLNHLHDSLLHILQSPLIHLLYTPISSISTITILSSLIHPQRLPIRDTQHSPFQLRS